MGERQERTAGRRKRRVRAHQRAAALDRLAPLEDDREPPVQLAPLLVRLGALAPLLELPARTCRERERRLVRGEERARAHGSWSAGRGARACLHFDHGRRRLPVHDELGRRLRCRDLAHGQHALEAGDSRARFAAVGRAAIAARQARGDPAVEHLRQRGHRRRRREPRVAWHCDCCLLHPVDAVP
jgi:hypothetical protein